MKSIYRLLGLSPLRAAILHLILLGIPLRCGLLPTGWLPDYLSEPMFAVSESSDIELFVARDMGVKFMTWFELVGVVIWVLARAKDSVVPLHKILLASTFLTLLSVSWVQNYLHRSPHAPEFEERFYTRTVVCLGTASALSLWTVLLYPDPVPGTRMKWSIPANAIFWGGVINLFMATASFQTLWTEGGLEHYFVLSATITSTVRLGFFFTAYFTTVHAILLLRMRTFLSVGQLRTVCLYKTLVNLILPIFWLPEFHPLVDRHPILLLVLRISLCSTYLCGYLWAGKAEGVSRMLSGEKDD